MIDEDLLRELATSPGPTLVRPLPEISARARVLRRRRRFTAAAATTLVVAGATAMVIGLPALGDQDRKAAPPVATTTKAPTATETLRNCWQGNGGSVKPVLPKQVPQVLFLPSATLAGPLLSSPTVTLHARMTCTPPASAGSWVSVTAGRVDRTVQVEGPDRADPTAIGVARPPMDGHEARVVDVDGARATLYYSTPERVGEMFWEAADGSAWTARVSGMTLEESLAAVRNVSVQDSRIDDNASPGGGFTAIEPFAGPPTMDGGWVTLDYGPSEKKGWRLTVFEFHGQRLSVANGSHPVDINGRPGWWIKDADGLRLNWEVSPGVRASLGGDLSAERAIALARATVQVEPTDPRWHE